MARGLVGSRRMKPEPLERVEVGVDGRRGRETDRLADLADRRRIAPFGDLRLDEDEDLSLAG